MMMSSDNNKNKVCLHLKDDVGGSRVRLRARSNDLEFCDHVVTIVFLFGISFDKQIIVKKLFVTR